MGVVPSAVAVAVVGAVAAVGVGFGEGSGAERAPMTDQRSAPRAPAATGLYDTPAPWPWTATAITIAIYVGSSYLVLVLFWLGLLPVNAGVVVMCEVVASSVLALLCVRWVVWTQPGASSRALFGLRLLPRDLGLGAAVAVGTFAVNLGVGIILVARLGSVAEEGGWKELADHLGRSTFAVVAIVGITAAPIVEELVFRAMLLRSLVSRFRVADRIAVAAVVFGLIHVSPFVPWQANLYALIQAGVFGAALCIVARLTGRLGPGIVAHVLTNVVAFGVLLAQTST